MNVRPRNKVKTAHSNGSEEHDQGAAPSSDAKTQTMRVGNPGHSTSERSENTVRCAKLEILEWPMDIIKEVSARCSTRSVPFDIEHVPNHVHLDVLFSCVNDFIRAISKVSRRLPRE